MRKKLQNHTKSAEFDQFCQITDDIFPHVALQTA